MNCRHCAAPVRLRFLDLGASPPSNSYLTHEGLSASETWYPLRVRVCEACWLVQTEDHAAREEFFSKDYAYFSSFSASWLTHSKAYVEAMIQRFGLNDKSHVVEIASNDGYLLQYVKAAGIACTGIEPTTSTAIAARTKGIETIERFFGVELARELVAQGKSADLTAANNVLAHVPDINDFVAGFACLLKPQGVSTFEFPHLYRMVKETQFDTTYHEHYSYLSLLAVERIFKANGLSVFDVEELPTHGGSLRVFAQRSDTGTHPIGERLHRIRTLERDAGMDSPGFYAGFQARAERVKDDLVTFLIEAKRSGKKVGAYGAAAKGNTLLNFGGVRSDMLPYVVDANPAKQGKFLPGSRIPVVALDHLMADRPDYVLILPWNLKTEVMSQLGSVRGWGGRFVVSVPKLEVIA